MMNQAKLQRVFIGSVLVFLSLLSGAVAVYYLEKDTHSAVGKMKTVELKEKAEKLAKRAAEIEQEQVESVERSDTRKSLAADEIPLSRVVDAAAATYSHEERNRREGLLWIDAETSQYIATLGAVNGVLPGKNLVIYDNDKKIGVAVVDTSFDVISYVKPSLDNGVLGKGYYKVLAE